MKKIFTIGLLALTVLASAQYQKQPNRFTMPKGVVESDYMAKTVVVKFKESQRIYCSETDVAIQEFTNYINGLGLVNLKKKFKGTVKPEKEFNKYGMKLADLSLIYEFEYLSSINLPKVINHLYSFGIIEYAEPNYVYHLSYSPNDPELDLNLTFQRLMHIMLGMSIRETQMLLLVLLIRVGIMTMKIYKMN